MRCHLSDRKSSSLVESLLARIESRAATVAIVGLGYVGLPLAGAVLEAGFHVIGLDIDAAKVSALKEGKTYLSHLPADKFAEWVVKGNFEPTTSFEELRKADAILICVPTPLTRHREPDLSFVESTGRTILPHLRRGQVVVLESTSYPARHNARSVKADSR